MMAAYPPGNNMQHPGLPHGHPGMAPTPNQHMGQQMQMHAGVSAPPHVSQPGAMMGMQPGMQPGAQGGMAGQHPGVGMGMPGQGMPGVQGGMQLTPQQQQQFLQQQQQQQAQMQHATNNPQMMAQIAQQQQGIMRQRMIHQATQIGIPQHQAQSMGLAQLQQVLQAHQQQNQQAFQNNQQQMNPVQLPAHLAQQQMQVRQQQQQAQQSQQQALMQQQQQQQQQAQQAQHLAMQHANSQSSNPGQSAPQAQPGPPGHPGQMRPASRMQNPNEQGQTGQPPPHPQSTPQQGQAPQPPPMQPQQSQQGNQPTPQTTPQQAREQQNAPPQPQASQQPQQGQPGQQGQQQQQQQQPQNQQAQQQQQQMMIAQRNQQMLMAQRNAQMQQQRLMAAQQAAQPAQQSTGQYVLKLLLFSDKLSSFCQQEGERDGRNLANWSDFIDRHFLPEGRLIWAPHELGKKVEIPKASLPRFFWMYFDTGAERLRLHTEHGNEVMLADGRCRLRCQNATLTVSYPNGSRVEMSGPLTVLFSSNGTLIEGMEFSMNKCEEHMSRAEVEKVLTNLSPTLSNKQSPKMTKGKLPKAQQKLQQQQDNVADHLPKAPKGQSGMTMRMLQFLEISETMGLMEDLMIFAQEKNLRPNNALDQLVSQYEKDGATSNNPQINLPPGQSNTPNGMPLGAQGTPRMGSMGMPGQPGFQSSPSVSNMNLPMQPNGSHSSPHLQGGGLLPGQMPGGMGTPSPAQTHMAAPPMMPQHSQQGTTSSGASANTSPQVNNKRRRSTVKMEGEDGLDGGHKVKPSPRMPKKPKPS